MKMDDDTDTSGEQRGYEEPGLVESLIGCDPAFKGEDYSLFPKLYRIPWYIRLWWRLRNWWGNRRMR